MKGEFETRVMRKAEHEGDEVFHIECVDRKGVHCQTKVTTSEDGCGVIEITRDCPIQPTIRRSFRSRAERRELLSLMVLNLEH